MVILLMAVLSIAGTGDVALAQNPIVERLQSDISRAMDEGDAQLLFEQAARQIDISISGEEGLFSRAQATLVLRRFFSSFPPGGFDVTETSVSEGRLFILGIYRTSRDNDAFGVFVYLRVHDGTWELKELRIGTSESS